MKQYLDSDLDYIYCQSIAKGLQLLFYLGVQNKLISLDTSMVSIYPHFLIKDGKMDQWIAIIGTEFHIGSLKQN